MHNHLGEVYMGTVAGITPRGVFVELENTVEGFVPAAELCKGEPQVVDGVSMVDPLTGQHLDAGHLDEDPRRRRGCCPGPY